MNLSTEMLDFVRFLGVQIGFYPDHYQPTANARALVYASLENYRRKYITPDRQEEFYTIAVAALSDGEAEGKQNNLEAKALVEANRSKAKLAA